MDASNTPVGAVNTISKATNNMQTEVAENHRSEGRPLLDNETKQNISRAVNNGIPSGTANDGTEPPHVNPSNDVPITTEPVPISSQPTSAVESSDNVADGNENPPCCTCCCNHCHFHFVSCRCFGFDCGHPCICCHIWL